MDLETRIGAARVKIDYLFGYYSAVLWNLAFVPCTHPMVQGTMAVDRYFRVYYDPTLDWTVDQITAVLVHELNHPLRGHHERAEVYGDDLQQKPWLWSTDGSLNQDLVEEPSLKDSWPWPPVVPETFGCDTQNQTCEWYYEWLLQNTPPEQQQGHDCGSGAGGEQRPWEQGAPDAEHPGVSEAFADQLRRQVAEDTLRWDANGRGTVPAGLKRWAEGIVDPQVPWRKVIPAIVRNAAMRSVMNRLDYSYHRPHKRVSITGFFQPVLRGPEVTISFVGDTSGSMGNKALSLLLAELKSLFRQFHNVDFYSADAAVHTTQKVVSADMSTIKLLGNGGTDMDLAITEVDKRKRYHAIVCCTDALTPFPDKPTRAPLVLVVVDNPNAETPTWATTVHVSTKDAVPELKVA